MSGFRILIVEDNPDTRELLCEQLEDERYELLTAKDGQDAILRVGERAPDVVIMDVMMPNLDGFETGRYLKLRFRERFTPILMLTAKSDVASREEGARYGCEDYRGKPYTRQQLLVSVEALLELGRLENLLLEWEAAQSGEPDLSAPLAPADPLGGASGVEPTVDESAPVAAPTPPSPEEVEAARQRVIELRMELAHRQLGESSYGIARAHAERVLDLSPKHEQAALLLNRIDAGLDGR